MRHQMWQEEEYEEMREQAERNRAAQSDGRGLHQGRRRAVPVARDIAVEHRWRNPAAECDVVPDDHGHGHGPRQTHGARDGLAPT